MLTGLVVSYRSVGKSKRKFWLTLGLAQKCRPQLYDALLAIEIAGTHTSGTDLPPYTTAPRHRRIFTIDFTDHAVGNMHRFGDGASRN